jgi:hypothetical protein
MTKINRAAIIAYVDAERVRITRNGEVHAYGHIPHSIVTGWYLAGFTDHILDAIAERANDLRAD